jgi:NIMA (never in mitosis gene a)-related kinase 1/4/5
MAFCSGGDLGVVLQRKKGALPEEMILDWFVQICLAIKHVHDHKILHRDVKPQNVFLAANGLLKLGDFGVSKVRLQFHGSCSLPASSKHFIASFKCLWCSWETCTVLKAIGKLTAAMVQVLDSTTALAATGVGTPYYLSPEICRGQKYSFKSDIWSSGCILYEMACGRRPFDGVDMRGLMGQIMQGRFKPGRLVFCVICEAAYS